MMQRSNSAANLDGGQWSRCHRGKMGSGGGARLIRINDATGINQNIRDRLGNSCVHQYEVAGPEPEG